MNVFRRFFGTKTPSSKTPDSEPEDPIASYIANYVDGGLADTLKKTALADQHAKRNDDTDITLEIDGTEIGIQKSAFDRAAKMYAPILVDTKALVKKATSLKIGNPDREAIFTEIETFIPTLKAATKDAQSARAMVSREEVAAHYKLGALEMKLEMAIIDLESEMESMREDDVDFALEISELIMPDGAFAQYRIEQTYSIRKNRFIDVFLISRDPYGPDHPSLYCWSFAEHERINIPVKRVGEIVEIDSGKLVRVDELTI